MDKLSYIHTATDIRRSEVPLQHRDAILVYGLDDELGHLDEEAVAHLEADSLSVLLFRQRH